MYQELSFQDSDALGDIDEGADITGKFILVLKIDALYIEYWLIDWAKTKLWKETIHISFNEFFTTYTLLSGGWVHPGDYASAGWWFLISSILH